MYSVVLAAVMTGGAQTPDFCFRGCGGCFRCHGCHWCGGCRGWCGCYCGGWCGGYCGGWCGCYSGGWCGHWCHGWCGGSVVVHGCHHCYGYSGGYAYSYPAGGTAGPRPADPGVTPQSDSEREAVRKVLEYMRQKPTKPTSAPGEAAQVTVHLPADARLYIDNTLCPLTSTTRTFRTPALEQGRQYFYTLRVEVNRDGQTVTDNRRVVVAAGRNVEVNFNAVSTAQR